MEGYENRFSFVRMQGVLCREDAGEILSKKYRIWDRLHVALEGLCFHVRVFSIFTSIPNIIAVDVAVAVANIFVQSYSDLDMQCCARGLKYSPQYRAKSHVFIDQGTTSSCLPCKRMARKVPSCALTIALATLSSRSLLKTIA